MTQGSIVSVDIAINHDPEAISIHAANHPHTQHYTADVFEVDPLEATQGQSVGLLWAYPSCTHFSRAHAAWNALARMELMLSAQPATHQEPQP